MNRSALIVIVDFLLVSLLAFSRLDELDVPQEKAQAAAPAVPFSKGDHQDLVDVLKLSLDKERESRDALNAQLRQTQSQLQNREQTLAEREKLMRDAEQVLQQKSDEASRLQQERATLAEQFAATQTNLSQLQKQLTDTLSDATLSRKKLESIQTDLQAREQEEAVLQRKMNELEQTRLAAEAEKQRLATQLQVAQT